MVTITIKTDGREYVLDIDEANKLYVELEKLFGGKNTQFPWNIPWTAPTYPTEPYYYKSTGGTCDCISTKELGNATSDTANSASITTSKHCEKTPY